jgi:hypothetical protein
MPTVLTVDGFRVVIWYGDHEPPHVHVFKANEEAVINLGNADTAPSLREVYMRARDVRRALRIVYDNQEFLVSEWERING